MTDAVADGSQQQAPDFEAKATAWGWRPKDQYNGTAEWVDAKTFVERGEQMAPFLKSQNLRLEADLAAQRTQTAELQRTVAAANESIEGMKSFQKDMIKQAREAERAKILRELREAKRGGDADAEVAATAKLSEHDAERAAEEHLPEPPRPAAGPGAKPNGGAAPQPTAAQAAMQTPEWKEFVAANPWVESDPARAAMANAIGAKLAAEGRFAGLDQRASLQLLAREANADYERRFGNRGGSRVEGGARPNGGQQAGGPSSGGRSFGDLPADAKAACDKDGKKMVGEGPGKYKDLAAWRSYYVEQYQWE